MLLLERVFNFYALAYDFKTELRRCSVGKGHESNDYLTQGGPSDSIHQKCAPCAHSPRTHGALRKWCNVAKGPMELHFIHAALGTSGSCISCFVLRALRRCQATKLITWECQYSMFLTCFTRIERVSGNKIDSLEVPTFNVSIVFHSLWEDAGWHNWMTASAPLQGLYCVHALKVYQVTKFIRWECAHSTSLLRFTCSERVPGKKLIPWEWPHSMFLLLILLEDTGQQSWFPGGAHIRISIVF